MAEPNKYALILAGGSGTRFWPLSRNARPKQLLNLFGGKTLLEETIERLDGLVPQLADASRSGSRMRAWRSSSSTASARASAASPR